ncbi:AAA family ATPase [Microbacterium sp. PAMC22086]|uniref:AAA family ATPase n=1 Tax=Microbacterium sp. PAMC22086 TaxID=2861281 RepID=UPI001C62C514|nr:AAA family ATPase [Microbacterium sp. PAMC22086]QYG13165.1 AAA family ATPase [Microbacterium sp. PAMC22086]
MAAEEVSVNLGDATPRRLLVGWANGQDAWVRQITAETILSRQAPSDALLDAAYTTFLADKGLGDGEAPEVPKLELVATDAAEEETLELVSLASIEGVNALAADQELGFDPELTVLFGQNGSGKTGYARILKRISAVRTAEDILPNAHTADLDSPPSPSATIQYRLSGMDSSVMWKDESGLAPFTRISVFDASAVSLHVDSDLGYVYTPAELALFGHVAAGLQGIQQRIATEVKALAPGSNSLLSRFTRGTKVYPVIETLGATTDLAELDALATLPDGAEADRERLEGEIAALRSNSLDAILSSTQETVRHLNRLHGVLTTAMNFDAVVYEKARVKLQEAEGRRTEAREQLFSQDELPGPADGEWQEFIVAGDSYRQHLDREHYPTAGDKCLYCMQELSPTALNLLTRYRTFLDETLVRQVADTNTEVRNSSLRFDEAELTRANEFATEQRDGEDPPVWASQACDVLAAARAAAQDTANGKPVTAGTLRESAEAVASKVGAELATARAAVQQMSEDKANAASALTGKQKELSELTARIELNRNIAAAREYVRRARRAQQLDKLSRVISSGASKQLTVQSKLASEDLVNKNFETLFAEECARLRAPQVALRFQGRSGQAQRKKAVASYKPSAVLSEGEQKVLALADFLAESRMRGTKAPLIFDDPVTSLDYRRLDEVAARIQNLAETHQVVVLTHNIMFASALMAARQNKKLRTKIYEVRDGGEAKGILAPDVEPRLDTPADLAKRINVKLQEMTSAEPVVQDALIKETYDLIRAWCEAFVEQELLQNVTQRYRKNIMMTRLSKIDSSRLDAAIAVIEPLFDRACERMTGHSHAAEYMSTKPTVSEVQEDWEKAKAARSAYIAT